VLTGLEVLDDDEVVEVRVEVVLDVVVVELTAELLEADEVVLVEVVDSVEVEEAVVVDEAPEELAVEEGLPEPTKSNCLLQLGSPEASLISSAYVSVARDLSGVQVYDVSSESPRQKVSNKSRTTVIVVPCSY